MYDAMMVLCGQSNQIWHYFAGKFPGRVGVLLGPSYFKKQAIRSWMPYALDNDAYTAWSQKKEWDEGAWLKMLESAKRSGQDPLWVLVPDVVADKEGTLEQWHRYGPLAARYGWPLAFAVQDGMTPGDVPNGADVVFVGGTTEWKWSTLPTWANAFPRVHVGRVNEMRRVFTCESLGVESVDGSGWFRDTLNGRRIPLLQAWLEGTLKDHPDLPMAIDRNVVCVCDTADFATR